LQQWYQCPNCGAPVAFGTRFCGNCGAQITGQIQQPERWVRQNSRQQGSKWDFLKPGGRFSRVQFAFFYFIPNVVTAILWLVIFLGVDSLRSINDPFFWIPAVAGCLFWPSLICTIYLTIIAGIRRFHDLNKSGWHMLLLLIPIVYIVVFFYLLFAPGKLEGNRWLTSS
jgi:uncharacterized membrane protein YhaH (DUF805 family)